MTEKRDVPRCRRCGKKKYTTPGCCSYERVDAPPCGRCDNERWVCPKCGKPHCVTCALGLVPCPDCEKRRALTFGDVQRALKREQEDTPQRDGAPPRDAMLENTRTVIDQQRAQMQRSAAHIRDEIQSGRLLGLPYTVAVLERIAKELDR